MILVSQNVQIAEKKDFVREKISGIFFVNTPQKKAHLQRRCAFFSYIRLRRVILLRSYIRLTPSDIRFASFGGEYNITEAKGFNITFAKQKYHADNVSISLKT